MFDHPLTKEAEKHIYIGTETRDNYAGNSTFNNWLVLLLNSW